MKIYINKIYYFVASCISVCLIFFFLSALSANASSVPYLSLIDSSGGIVTVTVTGADPNVSVLLYYPSTNSYTSLNIGTTNASGYLMTTINSTTYNIAQNAPVYVMVDGQQSQQQAWPNYASSGAGLSFSQSNVTLSAGQSTVVSASVSAALTLSNNSNPGVASANISGNQITIMGIAFGSSNIEVCAAGIGCGTIQVSVSSSGATVTSVLFSQSSIVLSTGQFQQITISGSGSYYISSNSNSAVVSTNLSGSTLSLSGVAAGNAVISVCSASGGSTTCGTVNVTVVASNTTSNTTTNTATLTFSPSQVNLVSGQTQSTSIYGGTSASTVYYVSNNPNPSVATANTSGTSVSLTGISFGGDNITICQSGGPCGNLYVYVSSTNTVNATQTVTSASNITPILSSFSVSSNDAGTAFVGNGNILTLNFSLNQTVNIPTVTIGGSVVSVVGSGSGPYTATYTVPVGAALPLSISITFSNPAGTGGQSYFWLGNSAVLPTGVATTQGGGTNSGQGTGSSSGSTFTRSLYSGMTAFGVADPEVTALQKRLKSDGVYSGPITGYFGPLTKVAVEAYQKKNGLSAIGVVGPGTRSLLNKGI